MRCAAHPDVETNLRCNKCGESICSKCMVHTPIGTRCESCARLHKLPTYSVPLRYYLKAVGTGLGIAVICGVIWGVVINWLPFYYLNLLVALVLGYSIGEIMSLSVNRKRGIGLAIIAGVAITISYLLSIFLPWGRDFVFSLLPALVDLLALASGVFVAVKRLW